jgi:hypothetical protein
MQAEGADILSDGRMGVESEWKDKRKEGIYYG